MIPKAGEQVRCPRCGSLMSKRKKMIRDMLLQVIIASHISDGECVRILARLINEFKRVR